VACIQDDTKQKSRSFARRRPASRARWSREKRAVEALTGWQFVRPFARMVAIELDAGAHLERSCESRAPSGDVLAEVAAGALCGRAGLGAPPALYSAFSGQKRPLRTVPSVEARR
jgi:hypothetical protein